MILPHELRKDQIKATHQIDRKEVVDLQGIPMIFNASVIINMTAKFDEPPVVPKSGSEYATAISRIAMDGLFQSPYTTDHLFYYQELVSEIGHCVEGFNWWPTAQVICTSMPGMVDRDVFSSPPKDVLCLKSENNPHIIFNFFNLGLLPLDDEDIASAMTVLAACCQDADLTSWPEGSFNTLIVPAAGALLFPMEGGSIMNEDILKVFGRPERSEDLPAVARFLRKRWFKIDDAPSATAAIPNIESTITPYEGGWGLRLPSKVTFGIEP